MLESYKRKLQSNSGKVPKATPPPPTFKAGPIPDLPYVGKEDAKKTAAAAQRKLVKKVTNAY